MASKKSSDLLRLIHSMSTGERTGYFRIAMRSTAGKDALHLRLFSLLAGSDTTADDSEIRRKLSISSQAHYSGIKAYLSRDIMNVLHFLQHEETPVQNTNRLLDQAASLLSRGCRDMAGHYCARAQSQAAAAEDYNALIRIGALQRSIALNTSVKAHRAFCEEAHPRLRRYIRLQETDHDIKTILAELQLLQQQTPLRYTPQQLSEVKDLLEELQHLEEANDYPRIRFLRLCALHTAYHLLHGYAVAMEYTKELLAHLQAHPGLVALEPEAFLELTNLIFYNDFAAGHTDAAATHLSRLSLFAETLQGSHSRHWDIIAFNTQLKIAHKRTDYGAVAKYLSGYRRRLLTAAAVLPPGNQLPIITSVCISLFVLDRWDEAEELLLSIKEKNRAADREDLFFFTALFHLLILFEKRDWYRLHNLISTTYHLLYYRKKLRPFERDLLLFLKRVPVAGRRSERQQVINGFLEKLEGFREDPVQRLYFRYFDFYGWLKSKAEGMSYRHYRQSNSLA